MTDPELERLIADIDRLYAYQPYGVTKSILEQVKAALTELRGLGPLRDDLVRAVEQALEIARMFRGEGMSDEDEAESWKLYCEHAPELRPIVEVLERAKEKPKP